MKSLLLILFLSATAAAQQTININPLPDHPQPQAQTIKKSGHSFFDSANVFAFAAHGSIAASNAFVTCRYFAEPFTAQYGYSKVYDCRGEAEAEAAVFGADLAVTFLLHKAHLHKLERVTPYLFAAGSGYGLSVTLRHYADRNGGKLF